MKSVPAPTQQGESHMLYNSSQIREILFQCISDLEKQPEKYALDPEKDFSRRRKLPFYTLTRILLSMAASCVDGELVRYFELSNGNMPTVSAFLQRKDRLRSDAYSHLLSSFNAHFPPKLYRGKYQLCAVDGSGFYLYRDPSDTEAYAPPDGRSNEGFNEIHAISLFDLLSNRYEDLIVQPAPRKNEFSALCQFADRFHPSSHTALFLADRGFASYNVYAHLIENRHAFLIRVKDINASRLLYGDVRTLPDHLDVSFSRILSRSQSSKKRLHPERAAEYRFVCKNVSFDFFDDSSSEYLISLRLIRFKISDGIYENLVTNLPADSFSFSDLTDLYSRRWGIETSFDSLKNNVGASAFHSKKRSSVVMELWLRLVFFNFASAIAGLAAPCAPPTRKHPCKLNFAALIRRCRQFILPFASTGPPDSFSFAGLFLPVRPGRSADRKLRIQPPLSFHHRV
ncbi:IS4 family transposase [bacterium]|nr:IS4 family transposase [bacterium]